MTNEYNRSFLNFRYQDLYNQQSENRLRGNDNSIAKKAMYEANDSIPAEYKTERFRNPNVATTLALGEEGGNDEFIPTKKATINATENNNFLPEALYKSDDNESTALRKLYKKADAIAKHALGEKNSDTEISAKKMLYNNQITEISRGRTFINYLRGDNSRQTYRLGRSSSQYRPIQNKLSYLYNLRNSKIYQDETNAQTSGNFFIRDPHTATTMALGEEGGDNNLLTE